jgi:predicted TIM-barrel fold metal-dependent hydrolase
MLLVRGGALAWLGCWPLDNVKMGTGYATLWNAFKRIIAGCSQTERLALCNGTAKRLYRLD